jgi:hypothetical protein
MKNDLKKLPVAPGKLFIVDNYLEAVGVMAALKNGVSISTVRRPLAETRVTIENLPVKLDGSNEKKDASKLAKTDIAEKLDEKYKQGKVIAPRSFFEAKITHR